MSEPPNLEALARRYLDLWQDQATALAGDAELARQIGQWLSMMQAGMVHGFQSPNAPKPAGKAPTGETPAGKTEAGAASAAAPLGGGQLGLDELARRLAALEKRLDRLEAGAQGGRPKPRRRTRSSKA
ncbi:MAG TPA: hypothetical protein VGJ31_07625 [Dongiaceae bacterium]|jgi:hypothetical protein